MEKVITNANIEEVLATSQPVVVDFWAPWCGPCRVLSPTVSEIADEFEGKAVVAKCNVDDCEEIAVKYGIRNIPTLVFLKDGQLVDRTVGLVSKQEIASKIESLI
ncbi:MAG: thioredoxin [Bacteroidales bacterium]|nr:thioredoxin [Bacteroidales bacterium]